MRRIAFAFIALVLGLLLSAVLGEALAQGYVRWIAQRGKLFRPASDVGWATLPNLDLTRRNADGEPWHIATDADGWRSVSGPFEPDDGRRVLVLGDSFAFGEGVEIEDRFDAVLAGRHPDWKIVNQGVMGYGTDQQFIAARAAMRELRAGDVLLLLTYWNDFHDLLRRSHAGRSKPSFTLSNAVLQEHPPDLGWTTRLRDRSYLLARLLYLLEPPPARLTPAKMELAAHVYRHLVIDETREIVARGADVLVAFHGLRHAPDEFAGRVREALERTCADPSIACVDLDPYLTRTRNASLFQRDGHWNADGHARVAEALDGRL